MIFQGDRFGGALDGAAKMFSEGTLMTMMMMMGMMMIIIERPQCEKNSLTSTNFSLRLRIVPARIC